MKNKWLRFVPYTLFWLTKLVETYGSDYILSYVITVMQKQVDSDQKRY